MKSIFAALAITSVAVAAHAEWSTPVKLREVPGFGISGPRLGTSAAGEAVALWADTPQPGVEQEIVASFLTPGSDWGSPGPVSNHSGYLQPPGAVAMAPDGTVVAAWE